jgi:hypothetical protein
MDFASTRVVVQGGHDWVDYLVAFGTVGAAAFAGWAALTARISVNRAKELIDLEHGRDQRSADEALWRHARRLTVTLTVQQLSDEPGVIYAQLVVLNSSPDPFLRSRIKLTAGGLTTWGPQLVGPILPNVPIELRVRMETDAALTNPSALVRVIDVNGNPWISDAQGGLRADTDEAVDEWIREGREWVVPPRPALETGTLTGAFTAPLVDWVEWRADMAGRPGHSGSPREAGEPGESPELD